MMDEREDGELSGSGSEDAVMTKMPTSAPVPPPFLSAYRSNSSNNAASLLTHRVPQSKQLCNSSDESSSSEDENEDCHLKSIKKKRENNSPNLNGPAFSPAQQMMLQSQFQQLRKSQEKAVGEQTQPPTANVRPRKKNNIWSNVLGEQLLSDNITSVGLKKLDGDRTVENYDYKAARELILKERGEHIDEEQEEGEIEEGEMNGEIEEREMKEEEDEEKKEHISKRLSRKRPFEQRLYKPLPPPVPQALPGEPIELPQLPPTEKISDEELVTAIAEALEEQKPQLIQRVVQQLGREKAIKFYYDTREAELAGGEEIMNGQRRRTSGGLFIQIVKRSGLSREEVALVFPPDEAQLQWRRRKRAATRRKNKDRERHNSTGPDKQSSELGLASCPAIPEEGGDSCDALDLAGGSKCPGSTPVTSPAVSPGPTPATTPIVTPHCSDVEDDRGGASKLVDTALAIVKAVSPSIPPLKNNDEDFEVAPSGGGEEMDVY